MKVKEHNISVEGVEMSIKYVYTPRVPASYYAGNGDLGYPEEPAEVEILVISVRGCDVTDLLSDACVDVVRNKLLIVEDDS